MQEWSEGSSGVMWNSLGRLKTCHAATFRQQCIPSSTSSICAFFLEDGSYRWLFSTDPMKSSTSPSPQPVYQTCYVLECAELLTQRCLNRHKKDFPVIPLHPAVWDLKQIFLHFTISTPWPVPHILFCLFIIDMFSPACSSVLVSVLPSSSMLPLHVGARACLCFWRTNTLFVPGVHTLKAPCATWAGVWMSFPYAILGTRSLMWAHSETWALSAVAFTKYMSLSPTNSQHAPEKERGRERVNVWTWSMIEWI